jgi:hypothetical protein
VGADESYTAFLAAQVARCEQGEHAPARYQEIGSVQTIFCLCRYCGARLPDPVGEPPALELTAEQLLALDAALNAISKTGHMVAGWYRGRLSGAAGLEAKRKVVADLRKMIQPINEVLAKL